jgi:aryl sulfotransferase
MSGSSKPEIRHSYEHHHLNASRWNDFEVRPTDVVISTSYKAGTTFMQTVVGNIIFHEEGPPASINDLSPWLDMRVFPEPVMREILENQQHQRFIKTHLPLDGIVFHEEVKYIVVGRDPRDVFMSMLNHWGSHTDEFFDVMNNQVGNPGEPFPKMGDDVHETWANWISKGWFDWEEDGFPYWSHLHHCKTWWEFRHLPNIEFFHYSDMLDDLEKEMRRVASYIGVDVPEASWPRLVEACSFATVKKNPRAVTGDGIDFAFKGGPDTFINKGTNGRWKNVLTEDEIETYRKAMKRTLPGDCATWLENGGPIT